MRVVLAPGASGTAATMRRYVDGLAARGIAADAIDIPKRRAEDAVDAYAAASRSDDATVIGGQSYGGRVASLLAARPETRVDGLVLISYPLHRPGAPDWEPRTDHWAGIRCPVLFLSGEADPFARIELLRLAIAQRLPDATLHTWPRVGHGLRPVLNEAIERIASFVESLAGSRSAR
ncbi:MAG: dienelactone hydrolase family protein [Chloroflexi bacterium]|nr:dienelactone hydrolase family protein [Chloroflexota bacterium]